jgi:hypothetical protein
MRHPPQRSCPRNSRCARHLFRRRSDPGPSLLRLQRREYPHLAGQKKTQRIDGLAHPRGIGHDRDALPLREMVDRDVEIVPASTGKPRADLVIQPQLAVPLQRPLHRRPQNIVAFLVGNPAAGKNADDVVGQLFDNLDRRNS